MSAYQQFLRSKTVTAQATGMGHTPELNGALFPHQRDTVAFLLALGRGAAFLDTGLGKTFVELEWARHAAGYTGKPALILTPLAVGPQMVREAYRFGIDAEIWRADRATVPPITVANYEKLPHLSHDDYGAVVLDESSTLKSFMGKTKRALCEAFKNTPFRLAATATPAPNDYVELGNHSDFLGVMAMHEMLMRWFINDTSTASQDWRLKRHAVKPFWEWASSWAMCISKPSDLGYDDGGYDLLPYRVVKHTMRADTSIDTGEHLFRIPEMSATSLHREKRMLSGDRADRVAALVNGSTEAWLVWCDTNYEADALMAVIPDAIEVRGDESADEKERKLMAFTDGQARVIVTKPSLAGFGLNWQHCANMVFAGLSFSYEMYYQAIRRCWRFGQAREVNVHVVLADTEAAIWDTIARKMADHDRMKAAMFDAANVNRQAARRTKLPYAPAKRAELPHWLRTEQA